MQENTTNNSIFDTLLQEFVYIRTYSRWIEEKGRRETWGETVFRYCKYMKDKFGDKITDKEFKDVYNAIYNLEVMPSMRALWSAGIAADTENLAIFNCAFTTIEKLKDFAELLYILMNGTGCGYSVERKYVNQLPVIKDANNNNKIVKIVFSDSKLGWARGFEKVLECLWEDQKFICDYSKIRPRGERLKTFGGRACLTDDCILYEYIDDRYIEINLRDLIRKFKDSNQKDIYLKALDETTGKLVPNLLLDIVDNGKAPVYEIQTKKGYKIKATYDHRFMRSDGKWQVLSKFNIGDRIAIGSMRKQLDGHCIVCKCSISPVSLYCTQCYNTSVDINDIIYISKDTVVDINNVAYTTFDSIISIRKMGLLYVYDLQMQYPRNCFIVNNFVSHNSGPEPLRDLINFTSDIVKANRGFRLRSIDVHDICCKIAEVVVVGGTRRCLPGYTRINLKNGIQYIKDVNVGDRAVIGNKDYIIVGKKYIGLRSVYKLKHRYGDIVCTPEHRLLVYDKEQQEINFKEARQIGKNDSLLLSLNTYEGTICELPTIKYKKFFSTIVYSPIKYLNSNDTSYNFMWLLGLVLARGYFTKGHVVLSLDGLYREKLDSALISRIIYILMDIGIPAIKIKIDKKESSKYRIHICSKSFTKWLKSHTYSGSGFFDIPKYVLKASVENRIAYIAGIIDSAIGIAIYDKYFTDITLGSTNDIYLHNLQTLFHSIGIIVKYNSYSENSLLISTSMFNAMIDMINKYSYKKHTKIDTPLTSYHEEENITNIKINKHIGDTIVSILYTNKKQIYLSPIHDISIYKNVVPVYDIEVDTAEIFVAENVIVHNSALISLSDLTDNEMANAKMGEFWRAYPQRSLSNNSVAYTRKPDIISFLDEWKNLYRSKSGERGIFSRPSAQKKVTENGRRDSSAVIGINPCFAGYEEILTSDGYKTFEELDGTEPILINADGEMVKGKVWKNGTKNTLKIKLSNKVIITCTPDHIFKLNDDTESTAKNLKGKRLKVYVNRTFKENSLFVKLGFIQGGGTTTRLCSKFHKGLEINFGSNDHDVAKLFNHMNFFNENLNKEKRRKFYTTEYTEVLKKIGISMKKLSERSLPKQFFSFKKEERLSFLKGLFSANGSVISKYRITLKSTCWDLVNNVKDILYQDLGIISYITVNKSKKVSFPNGEYICKKSYDLNIGNFEGIKAFYTYIGFIQNYKMNKLIDLIKVKSPLVMSIKESNKIDVYDFNEPKTNWGVVNGFIVHNCGEVLLRNKSLCNLTEVVVRNGDTFEDLKRKVKLATMIGTWQSTFTSFKFIDKKWRINCEEERLLGVSLTGLRDHSILGNINDTAKKWLSDLKHVAIATNIKIAKRLDINISAAITCVKPSGTVSLLVNSSAGAHTRMTSTGYYIRRVRITKSDSLYRLLRAHDFPMKCDVGQDPKNCNTWVLEFPCKAPQKTQLRGIPAISQLEYWKMLKSFWCVTGDTKILTDQGHIPIETLVGKKIRVWNGTSFKETTPFRTGQQNVYRVSLSNGTNIKCTGNHKFIKEDGLWTKTSALKRGDTLSLYRMPVISKINTSIFPKVDAYIQGFYSGMIFHHSKERVFDIYPSHYCCLDSLMIYNENMDSEQYITWKPSDKEVLARNWIPPIHTSITYRAMWIGGLIDNIGIIMEDCVYIGGLNYDFVERVKLLLYTLGIYSITKHDCNDVIKKKFYELAHKDYRSLAAIPVLILYKEALKLLEDMGMVLHRINVKDIKYNKKFEIKVNKVEYIGPLKTYCFTEPLTNRGTFNGVVTGQCEHNPSTTIYVKEDEWLEVAAWVYKNFDEIGGLTFLPVSDHVYRLAPYEDINKEEYHKLLKELPNVDFSKLVDYEKSDTTTGSSELACSGTSCEIF